MSGNHELTEVGHIDAMLNHLAKAIKRQMLAEVRRALGRDEHLDACRGEVAGHLERLERQTLLWIRAAKGASIDARSEAAQAIDHCFRRQHRDRRAEQEAFDAVDRLLDDACGGKDSN